MFDNITDIITRVFINHDRWRLWVGGLQNTLLITLFALLIGIVIGFLVAVVRVSHDSAQKPSVLLVIPNFIAKTYVTVIRGIPMMVQIMIMNFIIFAASRNLILTAIVAFGINSGAYVSEVFRGGILSVDKGQTEAGRSLGLSAPQTMRKIIMPQAIKNSLPALGNEFISLLKETSIMGVIGVMDITRAGNVIRGLTYDQSPLIFVAATYLVMVVFLEFLVGKMEKYLRKSDRPIVKNIHRKGSVFGLFKRGNPS
jgi:His/Glu/Gln/Arg/opine family amino acid ABC transporter permease subunit